MSTPTALQILEVLGPSCRDTTRRELLLNQTVLNGIDFVEFEVTGGANVLHVHFLRDLPTTPTPAYGLIDDPSPIRVHGGTRIVGVAVTKAVATTDPKVLDVTVDQQGDYSPYLLAIGWTRETTLDPLDPSAQIVVWRYGFDDLDRLFSVAPINFRPGCPIDFDCAPVRDCPPDVLPEPRLDYLAKDYASFRQMLLDLVAQRNPSFTERSPADIGIALLELFAYEGDQLSYFQDAVSNEMYLDTARQRESAKRHARLVDYQMHDGRNAWAYVHFDVETAGTLPAGVHLVTRIVSPMRFDRKPGVTPVPQPTSPPDTLLNIVWDADYRTDPALAQVRVFEMAATAAVDPLNNELRLHPWGNVECCLPRGTTSAHVYALDASGATAVRPPLATGDYLLLEEILSPDTLLAADADKTHRQVVRIESVNPDPSTSTTGIDSDRMHDKLFLAAIDPLTNEPTPVTTPVPVAQTLPLVEVTWRKVDALTFPLCLTALAPDAKVRRISVARGNIALADHGRDVTEDENDPDSDARPIITREDDRVLRVRVRQGPLTMQARSAAGLDGDVREATPAIALDVTYPAAPPETWLPVPDLLSSTEFQHDMVADVDAPGRAVLRFGDGEYGQRLLGASSLMVRYRVGNGRDGNIGADALAHIVVPDPKPPGWPDITALRNPLPARAGVDPELIEQVRQYAPAAFRATQYRAVTEDDYRKAALTIRGVDGAVASFRWTGSWYTVFVGIDPTDPENVITDARGITRLESKFREHVLNGLTRYRLAGYDLEIRSARYVPLDVAIQVCVKAGYFRGDVAHAVALALGSGVQRGGAPGFFNPANFTFGQPVYLSRLYAAVENVEGVESVTITVFKRHGRDAAGEIENAKLPIGAWEIPRLDNDRSHMENGTLTITAGGGS